jgi:arginine decarboxylase
VLRELHGFIHMFEDTPEFIARYVVREAKAYLDSLPPPFFRALTHYAADGSYSWHCPGHSGGVAFLKSPVGQMFHQFFGENMLRADVCNAVEELGQLLDHTGPVAASERNAARIFNADHLFFVTNGTSTSNKIVWHSTVAPGDIVVVDRNCHKSILHAIIMTGAIPVFLMPTRNTTASSGRSRRGVRWENIQKKIAANPFASKDKGKPRVLTITQSHLRRHPLQRRGDQGDARRQDRHPALRRGLAAARRLPRFLRRLPRHRRRPAALQGVDGLLDAVDAQAAGRPVAGLADPGAGFREPQARPRRLQRGLPDAHLDLAAVRDHRLLRRGGGDDGGAGRHGAGRGIDRRGARFPPRHAQGRRGVGRRLVVQGLGAGRPREEGIEEREAWMLKPGERWHGFGKLADGFNMLDPIKATVITPGLDVDGDFADWGIPAAIVTKYLAEHGVIVEKCGLYSFFIMFTIGITKGRWNTMVTELQQFKDDYDKNQPLWKVLPEFVPSIRATSASACATCASRSTTSTRPTTWRA